MTQQPSRNFDYLIKKGRRKSLGIYVRDGIVEVRAPHFVSKGEIEQWVIEKRDWIMARLNEHAVGQQERPDISQGGSFLFLGELREIEIIHGKPAIFEKNNRIIIAQHANTNTARLLEKWLQDEARLFLTARVAELAEMMNETGNIRGIQFRKTRSKWGHCTSQGVLQFNWLIIMSPPEVIDYLIVHELSHLKHMNHSRDFWQHVEQYCTDFRKHKAWLKNNAHKLWL